MARVDIRFEDGSIQSASLRPHFWIHVLVGDETAPGHRPTELLARDDAGSLLARQNLYGSDFTSRGAAEAARPKSDGSEAQNVMRAFLERMVQRDSGGLALQVDLARTQQLERIDTPEGPFVI